MTKLKRPEERKDNHWMSEKEKEYLLNRLLTRWQAPSNVAYIMSTKEADYLIRLIKINIRKKQYDRRYRVSVKVTNA